MALRVIEFRQLIQIISMFLIVQFGGLLLATMVFGSASAAQLSSTQVLSTGINVIYYVVYIAVVALVLSFLMKIYRGSKFFIAMEALVVFVTSFFVFAVLIGYATGNASSLLFGNPPIYYFVIAALAAITLVVAKNKHGRLKNAVAILSSIGFGLILGISFGFVLALIFMALLAVYDFIAVFVTKHMIALANAASQQNLALMIDVSEIEAVPRSQLTRAELSEFSKSKADIEKRIPQAKELDSRNLVPVAAKVALGTGDLGVPLMLSIAAYGVNMNFTLSFFVIFGAVLGLLLTMFILRKYKRALPAIPPLLFGILIGVGAYFLIFH
jgi:presenilin-like A22 family membrane protease